MTGATTDAKVRSRGFGSAVRAAGGVLGELLIIVGASALLFVAWQMWWYDPSVARGETAIAQQQLDQWATIEPQKSESGETPVVPTPTATGEVWGVLYVPRFGNNWIRPIAWGVDMDAVLNTIGVGTYPYSQMPGALGNTMIASHRSGMGSAFYDIHKLRLGDQIIIETEAGWYTYVYRNTEYVLGTGVGILDPVPQRTGAAPGAKILTMQSCNPLPISIDERIIVFSTLESFTPRSDGAPPVVAKMRS